MCHPDQGQGHGQGWEWSIQSPLKSEETGTVQPQLRASCPDIFIWEAEGTNSSKNILELTLCSLRTGVGGQGSSPAACHSGSPLPPPTHPHPGEAGVLPKSEVPGAVHGGGPHPGERSPKGVGEPGWGQFSLSSHRSRISASLVFDSAPELEPRQAASSGGGQLCGSGWVGRERALLGVTATGQTWRYGEGTEGRQEGCSHGGAQAPRQ